MDQYANDRGPSQRGGEPSEAEALLAFGRSMEAANLPVFFIFRDTKSNGYLQSAWSKTIFPDF